MRTPVVARMLVTALFTIVCFTAAEDHAAASCAFDTNDDGIPELTVPDEDGNGLCELPESKTHLPGKLRFKADAPVEFTGSTVLEADTIIIEPGAVLRSDPARVESLTLMALKGEFVNQGDVDLVVSDDLLLRGQTALDLGVAHLAAADRVRLESKTGTVTLAAPGIDPGGACAVLGANRVEIRARSADGSVVLDGVRVCGERIDITTKANLSEVGAKQVLIKGGSVVTTDPARTGLPSGGKITIDSTGRVTVTAASEVDAAYRLVIRTRREIDDLCLSNGPLLESRLPDALTKIVLTGVEGQVFDDGSATFTGLLSTNGIVQGNCP